LSLRCTAPTMGILIVRAEDSHPAACGSRPLPFRGR
jgi:hypothetical protein